MKNRVKGLLALCLAMCMVLAMTTVAFGANYSFENIPSNTWKTLQANDCITAASGCPFYVVDGSGNYLTAAHTEKATGIGYSSNTDTSAAGDRQYFAGGTTFTLPAVSKLFSGKTDGYHYEAKAITNIGGNSDDAVATVAVLNNEIDKVYYYSSGYYLITNALMLKAVPDSYTVKYDTDGGSTISDKTSLAWDGKVLYDITDPTKTNCKFVRWEYNSKSVDTNAKYSDLVTDNTIASITLTAVWEVIPDDETPTTPTPTHQHTRRQPATTVETPTTTVASPKTFDAGVAVYGVMAALSLTGTAAIIGKKRKF